MCQLGFLANDLYFNNDFSNEIAHPGYHKHQTHTLCYLKNDKMRSPHERLVTYLLGVLPVDTQTREVFNCLFF